MLGVKPRYFGCGSEVPWNECSWERKFYATFAPENESSWKQKLQRAKVPSMELSFLGAKLCGNESSIIPYWAGQDSRLPCRRFGEIT